MHDSSQDTRGISSMNGARANGSAISLIGPDPHLPLAIWVDWPITFIQFSVLRRWRLDLDGRNFGRSRV